MPQLSLSNLSKPRPQWARQLGRAFYMVGGTITAATISNNNHVLCYCALGLTCFGQFSTELFGEDVAQATIDKAKGEDAPQKDAT